MKRSVIAVLLLSVVLVAGWVTYIETAYIQTRDRLSHNQSKALPVWIYLVVNGTQVQQDVDGVLASRVFLYYDQCAEHARLRNLQSHDERSPLAGTCVLGTIGVGP